MTHPLAKPLYTLAAAIVLAALLVAVGSRHEVVSSGAGRVYVLDAWTGDATVVVGSSASEVR